MDRNLSEQAEGPNVISGQSTYDRYLLKKPDDTFWFSEILFTQLPCLKLLLLEGPLGVGKTSIVKGLGRHMHIQEPITSPTFALSQHYEKGKPPLVHLDLYRLEDPASANELFLQEEEEAHRLGALMVVEWPERLNLSLPDAWQVKLSYQHEGRSAQLIPPEKDERNNSTS